MIQIIIEKRKNCVRIGQIWGKGIDKAPKRLAKCRRKNRKQGKKDFYRFFRISGKLLRYGSKVKGGDKMRKIDIYRNGSYLCSTNQSKTCKAACQAIWAKVIDGHIEIGGQGKVAIKPDDIITAEFDKR